MQKAREHPHLVTFGAFALATMAVLAIAVAFGFSAFVDAWRTPHYGWVILCLGAATLAVGAYAAAYATVARVDGGPRLAPALVIRLVLAGFGPFTVGGGFAMDKRILEKLDPDTEGVVTRVLCGAALEWALLAPAAWVSATVLLLTGDPRPMPSVLWPWAIAVPVGFAVALPLSTERGRGRIAGDGTGWRGWLGRSLEGVALLLKLGRNFSSYWLAWVGGALYWALDIATLYAAARFIGLHLNVGEVVLAYATGYALTRRSLPLGGAGVTETLMTFALHWMGQPVPGALAAVVVYRIFNFALPAIPQLRVRRTLQPLLDGRDRTAAGARGPAMQAGVAKAEP